MPRQNHYHHRPRKSPPPRKRAASHSRSSRGGSAAKRRSAGQHGTLAAFFLRPRMFVLALLLLASAITVVHQQAEIEQPAVSQAETWLDLYDEGKESVVPTAEVGETQVHFIDVGQGDATLISQGGSYALIDAGVSSATEDLIAYLHSLDIETIDILVMTHPHADHIGAMDEVIAEFEIELMILPDFALCEDYPTSASFVRVMDALDQSTETVSETAVVGASYPLGEGVLEIVSIGVETDNLNDISVCTMFTAGGFTLLNTGDAETPVEEALLESGQDLSAMVFQAGHHGSSTSNSLAFMQAVQPELIVISCGLDNSYGHPHAAVLETYDAIGADYYRTDLNGNVVVCYTEQAGLTVLCEQETAQAA